MSYTLGEIARAVGGVVEGDESLVIDRVRAPGKAGAREIAAVLTREEAARLDRCAADALLAGAEPGVRWRNVVRVSDPRAAFVALLELFVAADPPPSIDPRATIAPSSRIGRDVSIGPGALIEDEVTIGDSTRIGANVVIGRGSVIGEQCRIMPNVTIGAGTILGRRVIIHSGTTIGADGFGWLRLDDGSMKKIPQLGIVEIGDDVEIGANCCVDRATLERTVIGRGTKIDNLVQIGHNATIGDDACIVAQAGIGGSVDVGRGAVLGGQAGLADHVRVAGGARIGAQAGVNRNLVAGSWVGSPAMPLATAARVFATIERLPDYRERLRALEDRLDALDQERPARPGDGET